MPVEIRELVIRTEIQTSPPTANAGLEKNELRQWKRQILEECRQLIRTQEKHDLNR